MKKTRRGINKMKVEEEILKIAKDITKNDDIYLDQNMKDVGFDSLTFIKFVVQIEEICNIEFDDDMLMMDKFSTIASIVDYVNEKI